MKLRLLFFVLSLTAAVPACSDDDSGSADNDMKGSAGSDSKTKDSGTDSAGSSGKGSTAGKSGGGAADAGSNGTDSASMKITAAKGGKLTLGKAALNIPAGALDSDETITVETVAPSSDLPDADSVKGMIYDFGPDGTKFSKPVELTLPSAGKPGTDEVAVISWLDEDKNAWQDLETTTNADGTLTAEVSHFTNFAVRFNGVVSSDCDFSACGGDVVGTWKVTSVCAEIAGPVIDVCPDALATLDLTLDGTATFNADGTRSTDFTGKSTITYKLSAECLGTITMGHPPASCDVLNKDADATSGDGPTTCTGDPADACSCTQENPESHDVKTGTYTIDGNTMTSMDDGDDMPTTAEFCIKGTQARFKQPEDLAVLTWIATKQ